MPDLKSNCVDLPDALREPALLALEAVADAGAVIEAGIDLAVLTRVVACSQYAAECLARDPGLLPGLAASGRLGRANAPGELAAMLAGQLSPDSGEAEFLRQLRLARHRELVRIIWRDQAGHSDFGETTRDLADLADAAINAALDWARRSLGDRHGEPRAAGGASCGFGVLGMGKLGGNELNFSSDVDLVFLYDEAGESDGPRSLSNEEYFRLLAQRIIDLLSRTTADGFVYRVDARLRPFGSAGPLAVSVPALEAYLLRHGRDWERYAYVKARVINDWPAAGSLYSDVLRPFVYRRYLDFGVFASLREMKAMIEAEVQKKEFRNNLKLGPGGIREIEFIAQALQLVRGGTVAELRERSLLKALAALARHDCLTAARAEALASAYRYLRLAENRVQAIADRQTHDLPANDTDRARLALAMGCSGWEEFEAGLQRHQAAVSLHFRDVVFRGAGEAVADENAHGGLAAVWSGDHSGEHAAAILAAAGYADPAAAAERIRRLKDSGVLRRLGDLGRQRLDLLLPVVLSVAGRQPSGLTALDGMVQVIEAIGRRSAYFALLTENPAALERLVSLCARSEFLARQVATHPLLLDELIDPRVFTEAPSRVELEQDLSGRLAAVTADDSEARLDALRNFQQAATFRVAVVDLSNVSPLMKISDRLTDIAELVLEAALSIAWQELTARHGTPRCDVAGRSRPARFAIIGYGKLGGLELGYGSDLDLVFLHDSDGESQQTGAGPPLDNQVFFSRLTRRIMSILTMPTTSGPLYEVDIRLRPSGRSGLLVSSLAAFDQYQRQDAWTWEHQALLRSRGVAGDPAVRDAFERLRVLALTTYVRRDGLRAEVADMRQRMRTELAAGTDELMDLKQDPGGIADIEFMVQYLVLREAGHFPDLVRWSDNIRQLEALAGHGILEAAAAAKLADAYREYRQRVHRLNLAGQPAMIPRDEVSALAADVRQLWQEIFGEPADRR
jgi:glutamate-ammonia-ligase adenylyltransferase